MSIGARALSAECRKTMASLGVLFPDRTVLTNVQGTPATDPPEHQSHSQSPVGAQSPRKTTVPPELAALDITEDITKKKPDPFLGFYFDVYRGVLEVESSRSLQHVVAIKSIPTGFDPRSKRQECDEFGASLFIHKRIIHSDTQAAGALVDELRDPRLADPGLLSVFEKGPLADGGSNAEYRWMAPELLSDQRAETTFATDVYAFTMTCWMKHK
ncbi:hypothetical protein M422DRAFT_274729 [Sphaerobolus stellatus SS14]|uniref:Protein kinase domain-containing protein n=1 Tax=Sphaerobolus stellatus (strain SS14) TaxID=990650 RepID=A0A0C9T6E1_SPHS4|nr:hypothetical protein M422DRAFT_274729 [Sphaerobolus stellatus SS14]